jgi:hypothetical protein
MAPPEPATGQITIDSVALDRVLMDGAAIGSNATPILGVVLGILVFAILALNALAY